MYGDEALLFAGMIVEGVAKMHPENARLVFDGMGEESMSVVDVEGVQLTITCSSEDGWAQLQEAKCV